MGPEPLTPRLEAYDDEAVPRALPGGWSAGLDPSPLPLCRTGRCNLVRPGGCRSCGRGSARRPYGSAANRGPAARNDAAASVGWCTVDHPRTSTRRSHSDAAGRDLSSRVRYRRNYRHRLVGNAESAASEVRLPVCRARVGGDHRYRRLPCLSDVQSVLGHRQPMARSGWGRRGHRRYFRGHHRPQPGCRSGPGDRSLVVESSGATLGPAGSTHRRHGPQRARCLGALECAAERGRSGQRVDRLRQLAGLGVVHDRHQWAPYGTIGRCWPFPFPDPHTGRWADDHASRPVLRVRSSRLPAKNPR